MTLTDCLNKPPSSRMVSVHETFLKSSKIIRSNQTKEEKYITGIRWPRTLLFIKRVTLSSKAYFTMTWKAADILLILKSPRYSHHRLPHSLRWFRRRDKVHESGSITLYGQQGEPSRLEQQDQEWSNSPWILHFLRRVSFIGQEADGPTLSNGHYPVLRHQATVTSWLC